MSTQNKNILVSNVMLNATVFPAVAENTIVKVALEKMDFFRLGVVCIVGSEDELLGILTDGDIRRKLLSVQKPLPAFFIDDAINHAITDPITISSNMDLSEAVELMEVKQVWDLPVVDNGRLVGLLHLHEALKRLLKD